MEKFKYLEEEKEKCKNFSIPIKKRIRNIDKYDNESVVNISY